MMIQAEQVKREQLIAHWTQSEGDWTSVVFGFFRRPTTATGVCTPLRTL